MNKNLSEAINNVAMEYSPPDELKDIIMKKAVKTKSASKTKVLLSVAIIALTIPLFAFIKQYFYADQIYGSYAQIEAANMPMSMEDYNRVDKKIGHALETLSAKDGVLFIAGISAVIQFKQQYGNEYGEINHFNLTTEQYNQYYNIISTVQPYFDILNGLNSSKQTLNDEEFKQYIEATILNGSITAASNVGYADYDYSRVAPQYEQLKAEVNETLNTLENKLRKTLFFDGVDYTYSP